MAVTNEHLNLHINQCILSWFNGDALNLSSTNKILKPIFVLNSKLEGNPGHVSSIKHN
jgi:hypothetical protein